MNMAGTIFGSYEHRAFVGDGVQISDQAHQQLELAAWLKRAQARLEQAQQELEAEENLRSGVNE
jgi:predicted NAD/FAD-binding protein